MTARWGTAEPAEDPRLRRRPGAGPDPLTAARMLLVLHRLDVETGLCAACAGPSPCEVSQEAARVLAESGGWNTATVGPAFGPPFAPAPDPVSRRPNPPWVGRAAALISRLRRALTHRA